MTTATDTAPKFELSPVSLIAGCLAAVTAAVLASFFGVGGTIIGTALGSIVGTAGTAIYTHSIRRTQRRLTGLRSHEGHAAAAGPPAAGAPAAGGGFHMSPRNWLMIGLAAFVAFAIGMAFVTGVEAAAKEQLSALVTGKKSSGPTTTVGAVTGTEAPPATPTPTTEPSSAPTPGFPGFAPTPRGQTPQPTSSPTPASPSSPPKGPSPSP
jgi:hypothetical protein